MGKQKNVLRNDLADGRLPNGRFGKGRSGNPKGRPKRSAERDEHEFYMSVAAAIRDVIRQKVPAKGLKGATEMPLLAVAAQKYLLSSVSGSPRDIERMFRFMSQNKVPGLVEAFEYATREMRAEAEQLRRSSGLSERIDRFLAHLDTIDMDYDDPDEDDDGSAEGGGSSDRHLPGRREGGQAY